MQTRLVRYSVANEHWLLNCSVICKLRNGPPSPQSLCSSVIEHHSAESKGLKFDSSWGLRNFSLSHTRDKTKSIFFCSEMFQKAMVWFINCTLFSSLNQIILGNDSTRRSTFFVWETKTKEFHTSLKVTINLEVDESAWKQKHLWQAKLATAYFNPLLWYYFLKQYKVSRGKTAP